MLLSELLLSKLEFFFVKFLIFSFALVVAVSEHLDARLLAVHLFLFEAFLVLLALGLLLPLHKNLENGVKVEFSVLALPHPLKVVDHLNNSVQPAGLILLIIYCP